MQMGKCLSKADDILSKWSDCVKSLAKERQELRKGMNLDAV